MRKSHLLPPFAALVISASVPGILVSCSSGDDTTGTGGTGAGATGGTGGGSGTTSTGGQGAAGMASAGKPGMAGTGGTTGTGGSSGGATTGGAPGTGGAGGAGASAGGKSGGGGTAGGMEGGAAGEDTGPTGGVSAGGKAGGPAGGATGAGNGGTGGAGAFMLTSPQHMEGAKFDGKYTCDGGNLGAGVNPELDWSGVPAGTKSLAMTFIDTTIGASSPMGQHWAIWNIPWDANTGKVAQFPEATGMTLSGDLAGAKQSGKFLTPCAQSLKNGMDDEYEFTIFALSEATLNVTGTSVANALMALDGVTPLGTATLHGHAGLKGQ